MIKTKSKRNHSIENLEKRIEGLLFLVLAATVIAVFLAKHSTPSDNNLWSLTTQYTLESIIDDVTGSDRPDQKEAPPQPELGD